METTQKQEENGLPKSFSSYPPIANPSIPRLIDLSLKTIIENFDKCSELHLIPKKYQARVLREISTNLPLNTSVMTIPDGIYWKRLTQEKFPHIPIDPARKKWKRFYLENYAKLKLESATDKNIDSIFNELKVISPYIRSLRLERSPCKVSIFKLFNVFRGLKSLKLTYGEPRRNFAQYEEFDQFDVKAEHSTTLQDCQILCTDFQSLGDICTLERLDMSDNSLNDQSILRIAKGLYNNINTLTTLIFSHNEIGDKGAHAIASVMLTSPIYKFNLSDNLITPKGIEKICDCAKRCTTLQKLNLSSNQIGDMGIGFISDLIENTSSIAKIDISGNRISNFESFTNALNKNKSLKVVIIAANPINDNDYDKIKEIAEQSQTLERLDMRRYELPKESFEIKTSETSESPLLRFK
ncbi:Leucine Rich Repeat family protein [Histomonas meleagridis]|uniref:Leucine Rich Repeat family protein n=1 Tax=Histomonas meleagridis TaxID=135588 RepID=UPI0035595A71|nr:Leucine Rich Repeat family protein [Histomonas meleagridis]KAH0804899.1 Leucine Rich Repeat family protein [Histomonas meleagridis]